MYDKQQMNRIKEVLKEQGRTQTWLAESYVVVTNYCNNKTQPSVSVLTDIAKAIDVRELLISTK